MEKMLHYKDLAELGLGVRSTIWRKITAGEFPAPVRLGINTVAWPESQIDAWLDARKVQKCRKPGKVTREDAARP